MKTIFATLVAASIGLTASAQTQPGFGLPVQPDVLEFDFSPLCFDPVNKTADLSISIETNIPSVVVTLWDPRNSSQKEEDHVTVVLHGETSLLAKDVPYEVNEYGARVFSISMRNVLDHSYLWKRESRSSQSIAETK